MASDAAPPISPSDGVAAPGAARPGGLRPALVLFARAGLVGAGWRPAAFAGFPDGLAAANVRPAHSHLMCYGWMTPALEALLRPAWRRGGREARAGPDRASAR